MIDFVHKLGSVFSILSVKKIELTLYLIKSAFYSGMISCRFKTFGKKSLICYKPNLIIGEKYIEIGNNVRIDSNIQLTAWNFGKEPIIQIGNNSHIGQSAHITASNEIRLGDNFLCGKYILITDNSHGNTDYEELKIPPHKRKIVSKGPVIIHSNVWIGDKVTILPNVEIGESCIIAANSVVSKSVPPFSIVGGNPAKVIKRLI